MKLLIMQFCPTSCHFISLRSKYSPQHPVLKHFETENRDRVGGTPDSYSEFVGYFDLETGYIK
jgi:hypothetical protein